MKHEFTDRRSNAAQAKTAMLDRYKHNKDAGASGLAARLAARAQVALARDARHAARAAEKLAEQQRVADEAEAIAARDAMLHAAEVEEREAQQSAQERRIALVLSDDAARKAARDRRYAKRKASQHG